MKDLDVVLTWPLRLSFITIHLGLKIWSRMDWDGCDLNKSNKCHKNFNQM
jgi:hypothetical protein